MEEKMSKCASGKCRSYNIKGARNPNELVIRSILGKNEEEAEKLVKEAGLIYRLVAKDGENFIGTDDYRMDRVNVTIENGVVVNADLG